VQLEPNYAHSQYLLGMIYLGQHRYREARDVLQRAEQLGGFQEDLAGALASAYAQAGDRVAAARYIAEVERRVATRQVGPFSLALAYTGQGDLTRAFANLDRAITIRDAFLPEDFFDPQLDRLRADPRFAAMEAHMRAGGGPHH
jgi:cytochrome c-type biogenesis protein CcmH/NrfG